MTYTILGTPLSPFTRKVRLFAAESSIDFDNKELNPYIPPADFEKLNPLKRVPVLQKDDFTLADSSPICAYLNAAHPCSSPLIPSDPKLLGQALWIEEYADAAFFSVISEGIFRPIFINQLKGLPVDFETVQATAANDLPPFLTYLESLISGKEWFCGDKFSIADVSVYSQMVNLQHSSSLPNKKFFPELMKHYKRVSARPAAIKLHDSELLYLEKMRAKLGLAS